MKHFMNDRVAVVTEAIDAAVALSGGALARLDGFPAIKVVVQSELERDRVAVISGGGSGHEPAHAGFVGDGLLTAAVCGEIFASPSVDAVLAAILAVTGPAGCLLIVKSYTGDRLNFGLAAEKARALGRDVEMVVVGDDVAIEGALRPRGIAGTLFVHKVAGHAARAGKSLAEVKAAAERVIRDTSSIGLSLSSCAIPGQPFTERLGAEEVELGLGIHGEPGAKVVPLAPVRKLVADMVTRAEERIGRSDRVALLINDLGGVPPIEMALVTDAVLGAMSRRVSLVIGPDRLMTSLDMKGFSISLLALDDETEEALLSPVGPRAWPPARRPVPVATRPIDEALTAPARPASPHPERRAVLEKMCRALVAHEAAIDALDAKIGDGDTGTTFATGARAILADLDILPFADASSLCLALSERLAKVMGGSSGILLAIFAAAAGARFASWPAALRSGLRAVEHYGGAQRGDRTVLDALVPAIESLERGATLAAVATAARAGAEATAAMTTARAGRASYVRADALAGVPDPGAVAVATMFEALV